MISCPDSHARTFIRAEHACLLRFCTVTRVLSIYKEEGCHMVIDSCTEIARIVEFVSHGHLPLR